MSKENDIIELLKNELESKYNIGDRNIWTHQDFQNLSDFIQSKSGIPISTSTLKRLYGKITSNVHPRHSSLDAICIYLGYKSWYDFQQKKGATPIKQNKKRKVKKRSNRFLGFLIIAIVLFIGSYFIIDFFNNPAKHNLNRKFIFETADTIGILPYSVKLKVDITNLKGRKFRITHDERTSDMYLSSKDTIIDFFFRNYGIKQISLFQGKTKLKTIRVYTTYDKWMAEVTSKNTPTLLYKESQIRGGSTLTIPEKEFTENAKLHGFEEIKYISGFQNNISLDNFTLKTRYRYVPINGYDVCLRSYFTITGTAGYISFPFGHESCLKGLSVFIDGNSYPTIQHPELFSYNSTDWIEITIIKDNKRVEVYRNNKRIIDEECLSNWGDYLLTRYKFVGNGEIDYLRIYNQQDSLVYGEEFNTETD